MPENLEQQSTEALLGRLKETTEIDRFIDENEKSFFRSSVGAYLETLLEKYSVSKKEAIARSNIERGYAYQIFRGVKDARRDKYIRLAIGIGLDLEDTQRLLTVARHGILYSKILRDAVLIFCINNRYDIMRTEWLLLDQRADPLE